MQNLSIYKKIMKTNLFLLKKEKIIYFFFSLVLLFLIFSYTYFITISVSINYSIENSENILEKIVEENTNKEIKYFLTKEKAGENFSSNLVLANSIDYIDFSMNKVVYNK